ncbi:MAG: ImmA/IrrE family metallo-endopeptidase [Alphaproteobacteria bacterium]|nr:ImmA/IrrE family metallo-endopeptidase [Alphaproteobacteria bacterium]OJV45802.1 MAG: hypothetical protein BGO28_06250 [Alphaproteobacteria bacterium 43-37]
MVKMVDNVLENHWDFKLPVDPIKIAERMGVIVICDENLASNISGQFFYEGDLPTIRYNPKEHPLRQRFTIAHELGHFSLGHPGGYRDNARSFFLQPQGLDAHERAANRFAASLLMPEIAIYKLIEKLPKLDVSTLANAFQVSEMALHYRLKNLGIV